MNTQYRQGDLYFISCGIIPVKAKEVKTGVILHSDTTTHEHKLIGGKLYKLNDTQYARVSKSAKVTHDEHKPIALGKGVWEIRRQKEYSSKDATKLVVD